MIKIPDVFDMLGASGIPRGRLREFLAQQNRGSEWLELGPYDTYLRRAERYLPMPGYDKPVRTRTVDLANITRRDIEGNMEALPPEQRPPRGKFQELLRILEEEASGAGYNAIYAENIMNEFLPEVLARYGYDPDLMTQGQPFPSMIRYLNL